MLHVTLPSMLYPDGEVTRMLSRVTSEATYKVYYEKVLRIPADCHLELIRVIAAPRLRTIKVYGINNVLKRLLVSNIKMRKIPTTIRYLQQLQDLSLENGVLDSFSLKPLKGIRSLTFVNLRSNKLRRLQVCKDPNLIISIERLELAENLLEYIDMEFFTPFKWLKELRLELNQLKQITANKPVMLSVLHILLLGFNNLTQLNFSNWITPALDSFSLRQNGLTQLPIGIDRFANLSRLYLDFNQLTTLDLQQLKSFHKITILEVHNNQLHTVLPDCQSHESTSCQRISLPALDDLDLQNNFLTSIDFSLWDMPALHAIDLSRNPLKRLINLSNKFPKLNYLNILRTDIRCLSINGSNISENDLLDVLNTAGNPSTTCPTNSSFPHPFLQGIVCCNQ
ncbi:phospholipase A2 inhibitor-like [Anopheles albimanus]|uniref:phospholipase A2 inhibitor-like n=1 Tax=Anopheles albimanus TaxID=7167 RepID=UPI00163F95BF|nr:phospholipase A2 inhibitor-like [Anopheles albimanus]